MLLKTKSESEPAEYKAIAAFPEVKKADVDQGIVEHYISIFGIEDLGCDVVHLGAFTKTLAERGGQIRVLDAHQRRSVLNVLGIPLELKEVPREELPSKILERYPEATGGLWARTQFLMNTSEGRGAFERIKSGAVSEFSFGYDALDEDFDVSADGHEVRNLRTVRLWEYGPVLFGMNPGAMAIDAKGASGASNLPIADRERLWDASAAESRVRSWAGAKEKPNAKYRQAFFWYDSDEPDSFGSYKLPFADVINGTLTAIPRGIFAVAAVLKGARGGTQIPDVEPVKSKVAGYYARMRKKFEDEDIKVPWEKGADGDDWEGKPAPDVTENTIRIRVRPSGDFQEGTFRTINIGAKDNGIQAVIGRLKGEETTTIQSYIFDKEKWTVARARAWVKEHGEPKALSYTRVIDVVREAFYLAYNPKEGSYRYWIKEHFDEYIVVEEVGIKTYFKVTYTYNEADGIIEFAPRSNWVAGDYVFVERKKPASGEQGHEEAALKIELERQLISDLVLLSGAEAGPVGKPPTS